MFLGKNMFLGNDFHLVPDVPCCNSITGSLDGGNQVVKSSLACRERQTTARGVCNVRQGTLQKFLNISIKNSKCAVSNKHFQYGRPGRYENRRGSKIKAKQHQKTPTPDPATCKSEMSSPRRRENQELCHLTAKRQESVLNGICFDRKVLNETIVPRR